MPVFGHWFLSLFFYVFAYILVHNIEAVATPLFSVELSVPAVVVVPPTKELSPVVVVAVVAVVVVAIVVELLELELEIVLELELELELELKLELELELERGELP